MSNYITLSANAIPDSLKAISNPPEKLYVAGNTLNILMEKPKVAIVGSRKVTPYGKAITIQLAEELAHRGVVIISGLALGVDALAHRAALNVGGDTIAILPTGLSNIYPSSHRQLAAAIVEAGGALVSEYPDTTKGFPGNFVMRNRLVSGLSDAVLITEAAEKSGTLHTARFASAQGKPLFAVPGNITSPMSVGTNQLIQKGAQLVTSVHDILRTLGISTTAQKSPITSDNPYEQQILSALQSGISDGSELLQVTTLDVQLFNQSLTMLEITGAIKSLGNNQWTIA
jgi:DNA processing protein